MSEEVKDQAEQEAVADESQADQSTAQTGEDADTHKDGEDNEAQEKAEQEATEKKPWYKKRFDELTRKRYEAEAKIDAERSAREKLEAEVAELKKAKEPEQKSDFNKAKPNVDDYQTYEDYVDAITDWKFEKKEAESEAKRKASEVKKQQAEKADQARTEQQTFDQKRQAVIVAGDKKYRDFANTVQGIPAQILTPQMTAVIVEIQTGADIVYHLGKNIQEAERISKLNPWAMAVEIGKIEERLKLTDKKTTKAPPPINHNSGKSGQATDIDPAKDPEGWIEARNAGRI